MPSRCLLALRLRLERDVLSLMLRRDRLVSEVGDASSAEELFVALGTFHPDIVLLDSNLVAPADPALDAVRRSSGGPRFLVLAASGTPEDAVPWLAVRIDGYLPKSAQLEDLRRAVRTVLRGGRYIHPPIAEALVEYVTPDGFQPPSLDRLSTRERQIFDLIARGTRSAEIADKLGVSVKTVFTYRARMLQKLALRNNAQVVLFALRHAGDGRLDGDPLVPDSGVNDAEPST